MPFRWCHCAALRAARRWPFGAAGPGGSGAASTLAGSPQLPPALLPPSISGWKRKQREKRGQEVDHRREVSGTGFPCCTMKPLPAPWLCPGDAAPTQASGGSRPSCPQRPPTPVPSDYRSVPEGGAVWFPGEKFPWRWGEPGRGRAWVPWVDSGTLTRAHARAHTHTCTLHTQEHTWAARSQAGGDELM